MKILTGDTIIPLRSGEIITVDEVYKRFTNGKPIELLGMNLETLEQKFVQLTEISEATNRGMVTITTQKGRIISLEANHEVPVFDGIKIVTKQAGALELKDYLVAPRKIWTQPIEATIDIYDIDDKLYSVSQATYTRFRSVMEKAVQRFGNRTEVARHMGISPITLASWWQGKKNIPLKFLKEFGELMDEEFIITKVRRKSGHPITIPRVVTPELTELLGLLLSDGSLKGGFCIYFYNNNDDLRQRFSNLASYLFDVTTQESIEL